MTSDDKDATDKLLDHNRQQLSALLDDALSPDEARFLLRRLQHDESLAQCLSRWQLCGDVLRGQSQAPAPAGFASRVSTAIAQAGQGGAIAQAASGNRRARWGTGVALAASVAVLALFVTRQSPVAGPAAETQAQVVASQPAPAAVDSTGVAAAEAVMRAGEVVDDSTRAPAQDRIASDAGVAVGAVAAVAELPRRSSSRRSRGQSQRAAARNSTGRDAQPQVASAVAPSAAVDAVAVDSAQTGMARSSMARSSQAQPNPFTAPSDAIATRPWPRALLPGTSDGAFNVDYGRQVPAATRLQPFQLQAVPLTAAEQPAQPQATEPTEGEIAP